MTVKDLIKALQEYKNPEARVILQGCDCINDWDGSVEEFYSDAVILGI